MAERPMTDQQLRTLSDEELRRLQSDNPPNNADASSPANNWPNALLAEGKRRKLW